MRPDLEARLERAHEASQAHWSDDRARAVRDRIERRFEARRRRASVARVAAVAIVGSGVTASLFWWAQGGDPSHAPVAHESRTLHDGSVIVLLDSDTQVRTTAETLDTTVIALDRGHAEFRVTRNEKRVFRVEAGSVAVEVLGTVFRVEHRAPAVRVAVLSGEVRVQDREWSHKLAAGEEWSTDASSGSSVARPSVGTKTDEVVAPPSSAAKASSAAETPLQPAGGRALEGRRDWREMARRGQFQQAHEALRVAPEPRGVPDLLLAADAARLSHHPEEATGYLRTLLRDHISDPRASLAAFTLGKVLLDDLGKPLEAARAFAQSQSLDPSGALAEDALAREVEAYWRALDEAQAQQRAERYLKRYPNGRRARLVRKFGGME